VLLYCPNANLGNLGGKILILVVFKQFWDNGKFKNGAERGREREREHISWFTDFMICMM
jgi:hypothetical protein